ncbi:MAG: UTP--glucose-1-phosphate uridylyltransferase [Planctomycetaceae bacterium]
MNSLFDRGQAIDSDQPQTIPGGLRNPPPDRVLVLLKAHHQLHLLRHWNALDARQRAAFTAQIESIDWEMTHRLRALAEAGTSSANLEWMARCRSPDTQEGSDAARAVEVGREALAAGRFGAILVAGGQGTRLGFDGPKGNFPIGPLSGRTLFGYLLGGLMAVQRRYGRRVPLAIMTSSATDAATREALRTHDYFGLDPRQILVFQQGDVPPLTTEGCRMLLDAPDRVAMAPDGHGGLLQALVSAEGLRWFEDRGIDHVAYFQVDNPLVKPLDPEFVGRHLLASADISTQVVEKSDPTERVGIVVEIDGKTMLVEYSDLPRNFAAETLPTGRLKLHWGSIAVHCFRLGFLDASVRRASDPLPFHLARKTVPFVNDEGHRLTPHEPNAWKFERFIFDLFSIATRVVVHRIQPTDGFAPLKNPPGSTKDGPEQVRQAIIVHDRELLARAGVRVDPGIVVEIDPAHILDERDIPTFVMPGTTLTGPSIIG